MFLFLTSTTYSQNEFVVSPTVSGTPVSVSTKNYRNPQSPQSGIVEFIPGCTEVKICLSVQYSGELEPVSGVIEDVEVFFDIFCNTNSGYPDFKLESLSSGWAFDNLAGAYSWRISTVTDIISGQDNELCFSFIVDRAFNFFQSVDPTSFSIGTQHNGSIISIPFQNQFLDRFYNRDATARTVVVGSDQSSVTNVSDLIALGIPYTYAFGPTANVSVIGTEPVVVNGTLVFDIPYDLRGEYYFNTGSGISLPIGTGSYTIKNAGFQACRTEWEGIIDEGENDILIDVANEKTWIAEANRAITSRSSSNLNVTDVRFINNGTGINATKTSEFNVSDCEFYTENFNSYMTPGLDLPFSDYLRSAGTGIYGQSIETSTVSNSQFFDLSNIGIWLNSSQSDIGGSTFDNTGDFGVLAIQDYRNSSRGVNIEGVGKYATPTFNNIPIGVFTFMSDLSVKDANFQQVETGIAGSNLRNAKLDIEGNTINAEAYGVRMDKVVHFSPFTLNRINNNDITIQNGTGIRVTSPVVQDLNLEILENTIEPQAGLAGIYLLGGGAPIIANNLIDKCKASYGIVHENTKQSIVAGNTINGVNRDDASVGIRTSRNPSGLIARNCVSSTGNGIQVVDQFDNPNGFSCNGFTDHNIGLIVGARTATTSATYAVGFLGVQSHTGNEWDPQFFPPTNTASDKGAVHEGNDFLINQSRLVVKEDAPYEASEGTPNDPDGEFFKTEKNAPSPNCVDCIWPEKEELVETPTSLDEKIALGELNETVFNAVTFWSLQRNLYRKLVENPNILAGNNTFLDFFASQENTTVGQFERFNKELSAILTTELDSVDFHEEITTLMSLNGSINAVTHYEVLQKQINAFLLENFLDDSGLVIEQNESLLLSMANGCPYSDGPAVWQARALVSELQVVFKDDELCSGTLPQGRMIQNSAQSHVQIAPNPTSGQFVVHFPSVNGDAGLLKLTAITGEQVFEQKLGKEQHLVSLNFHDLLPGVYIVSVMDGALMVGQERLIVQK